MNDGRRPHFLGLCGDRRGALAPCEIHDIDLAFRGPPEVLLEPPVLRLLELPLVLFDVLDAPDPRTELLLPLWLLVPDWPPLWSDFAIAR